MIQLMGKIAEIPTRPLKVLVVDDQEDIRLLLRVHMSFDTRIGEIREAASGAEAVTVCRDFAPDAVVLDHMMPEMTGEQAAAEIRRILPHTRIIAFSGGLQGGPGWADRHFEKGSPPAEEIIESLFEPVL